MFQIILFSHEPEAYSLEEKCPAYMYVCVWSDREGTLVLDEMGINLCDFMTCMLIVFKICIYLGISVGF